jgi:hypothetical protein
MASWPSAMSGSRLAMTGDRLPRFTRRMAAAKTAMSAAPAATTLTIRNAAEKSATRSSHIAKRMVANA